MGQLRSPLETQTPNNMKRDWILIRDILADECMDSEGRILAHAELLVERGWLDENYNVTFFGREALAVLNDRAKLKGVLQELESRGLGAPETIVMELMKLAS